MAQIAYAVQPGSHARCLPFRGACGHGSRLCERLCLRIKMHHSPQPASRIASAKQQSPTNGSSQLPVPAGGRSTRSRCGEERSDEASDCVAGVGRTTSTTHHALLHVAAAPSSHRERQRLHRGRGTNHLHHSPAQLHGPPPPSSHRERQLATPAPARHSRRQPAGGWEPRGAGAVRSAATRQAPAERAWGEPPAPLTSQASRTSPAK
jgi:hypothetical protein